MPTGSRLIYEGLDEEAGEKGEGDTGAGKGQDLRVKELNRRLFNFGPNYAPGIEGYFEFQDVMLTDNGQVGDGMLLPTLSGDGEKRIIWRYYPFEMWDQEMREDGEDVDFYRVEFKYVSRQGEDVWRRFDVKKDEIVRYYDERLPGLNVTSLATGHRDPIYANPSLAASGLFSPPMVQKEQQPLQKIAEKMLMGGLGEWLPTILRWKRGDNQASRGEPELSLSELSAIDDINRLLTQWKDAAAGSGNPALFTIDLNLPTEPGADGMDRTIQHVEPGDFLNCHSSGEEGKGRPMFPDNIPTQFPHGEVLDYFRQAVLGDTPNFGLDPTKISRFGELSGFAAKVLRGSYDKAIHKARQRLLTNGMLLALKKGIALLGSVNALPEGITADMIEPKIEFAAPEYSPDEMLKLITCVQMVRSMRGPVEDQVALLPYKPINPRATKKALQDSMEEMDVLAEIKASLGSANKAGAGLDNRARIGGGTGPEPQDRNPQRQAGS